MRGGRIATALRLVGRWDGGIVSHRLAEWICSRVERAWPGHRDRNLTDLEAQLNLYHTSPLLNTPIYSTRPSYGPHDRLRGPLCNFKLDADGRLWAYTDDLTGWAAQRLWWTRNGPVIAALHADFQPP